MKISHETFTNEAPTTINTQIVREKTRFLFDQNNYVMVTAAELM